MLRAGKTRLRHLYERHPLRVLFPEGDITTAVLVTTSGGLVAGDRVRIAVDVGADAIAHVTGAAAEKIYRSAGADTVVVGQHLVVENGGWLEFLPHETILFDRTRLRRTTRVDVAGGGFLGGGILVFGRIAMGERFRSGLLHDGWEVYRNGMLVWGDALHVAGDTASVMDAAACFAGAEACATLILIPREDDAANFVAAAREAQQHAAAPGLRAGVTAVNGLLVARWLGGAGAVRRAYAELACHLRQSAMGLPPRLPRLWHV